LAYPDAVVHAFALRALQVRLDLLPERVTDLFFVLAAGASRGMPFLLEN